MCFGRVFRRSGFRRDPAVGYPAVGFPAVGYPMLLIFCIVLYNNLLALVGCVLWELLWYIFSEEH